MRPLFLLLLFISCLSANATNYYVSSAGNDSNEGTSISTAWKTIAKVNSYHFLPGDFILFRRGDTWREQLNISSSGSANDPITFSAYGNGAKPVINGADIVKGWKRINGNIWGTVSPNATTTRAMVIIDDTIYTEVSSINEVNSPDKYFIKTSSAPDSLFIWSTTNPGTRKAEISKRDYCILAAAAKKIQYVRFINLETRYAGHSGLVLYGTQGQQFPGYCIVDSCDFYANRLHSCVAYDGHSNDIFRNSTATYNGNGFYAWISDNLTVSHCTTAHNIRHFIAPNITDGHGYGAYKSDNWIVENCVSTDDDDAIHTDAGSTASNAIIRYNRIYNAKPGSSAIGVGSLAAGATIKVYYNLIVNASGEAFSSYSMNNGSVLVYNNTMYLDKVSGTNGVVYLEHGSNFVFKNNIIVRDGSNLKTLFAVLSTDFPISNYNQFYQSNAGPSSFRTFYKGSYYTALAAWTKVTSQDTKSQVGDPLFTKPGSDWTLQAGSPCINKGVDVGLTRDIQGNPIVGLPDMGAFEYVNPVSNELHTAEPAAVLYPNPAHDVVNSSLNNTNAGLVQFNIYDLQGRRVMQTAKIDKPAGFTTTSINISQLRTGAYVIETVMNGFRANVSRFVKI